MMGRQPKVQQKLFYSRFNLDQRVPQNHILRKISSYIDFDFIYKEVEDAYGVNGNISVPPADASNNSVIKKHGLKRYLNKSCQILESRLEKEKTSSSKDDNNNAPQIRCGQ